MLLMFKCTLKSLHFKLTVLKLYFNFCCISSLERNICYLNTNKMESETLIQLSQEEADEKLLDIFVLEQSEEENNRLKK